MDAGAVGRGYADHLRDADLGLLAAVSHPAAAQAQAAEVAWLRRHPDHLPALLGDPRVFQAVFGPGGGPGPGPAAAAALASPFLIFAVTVHRAAPELESMEHVPERPGPHHPVPLFDPPQFPDSLRPPSP